MTAVTRWEHFPHEADIGVRGMGETWRRLSSRLRWR